jgi:hypothetical protein
MKLLLASGLGLFLFSSVASAQSSDEKLEGSRAWTLLAAEQATINKRYEVEKPLYHPIQNKDGSSVILVYQPYGPPRAALFGISSNEKVSWSNYNPTSAASGLLVKATGDGAGNVLVIWEGRGAQALNARLFDRQGTIVWTVPLDMTNQQDDVDVREHLWRVNALFWPDRGWVVTFSTDQRTVVQLLNQQGQAQWEKGTELVSQQQGNNPVSLIQDTPNTIFALWYEHGYLKKPETHSVFRAQRLDLQGKALWATPIEVGEAPDFGWGPPPEIQLTMAPNQKVRAQLRKGVVNDVTHNITKYTVLIDPQGRVEKQNDEVKE